MAKLLKREKMEEYIKKIGSGITSNENLYVFGAGLNINLTKNSLDWNNFTKTLFDIGKNNYREIIDEERIRRMHPKLFGELIKIPSKSLEEAKEFTKKLSRNQQTEESIFFTKKISQKLRAGGIDILTTNFELPGSLNERNSKSLNIFDWTPSQNGENYFIHGSLEEGNIVYSTSTYDEVYSQNFNKSLSELSNFIKFKKYKRIFIFGMSITDLEFFSLLSKAASANDITDIKYITTDYTLHIKERNFVEKIMQQNFVFNTIFIDKKDFRIFLDLLTSELISNPMADKVRANLFWNNYKMKLDKMNNKGKSKKLISEISLLLRHSIGITEIYNEYINIEKKLKSAHIKNQSQWIKWRFSDIAIMQGEYYKNDLDNLVKYVIDYGMSSNIMKKLLEIEKYISDNNLSIIYQKAIKVSKRFEIPINHFLKYIPITISSRKNIKITPISKISDIEPLFRAFDNNENSDHIYLNLNHYAFPKMIIALLRPFSEKEVFEWIKKEQTFSIWKVKAKISCMIFKDSKVNLEIIGFKHKKKYVEELENIMPETFDKFYLNNNQNFKDLTYMLLCGLDITEEVTKLKTGPDKKSSWIFDRFIKEINEGHKTTILSVWRNNYSSVRKSSSILESKKSIEYWTSNNLDHWDFRNMFKQWETGEIFPTQINKIFLEYKNITNSLKSYDKLLKLFIDNSINYKEFEWAIFERLLMSTKFTTKRLKLALKLSNSLDELKDIHSSKDPFSYLSNSAFGRLLYFVAGDGKSSKDRINLFINCVSLSPLQCNLLKAHFFYLYLSKQEMKNICSLKNSKTFLNIILWTTNFYDPEISQIFIEGVANNMEYFVNWEMQHAIAQSLLLKYYFGAVDIPKKLFANETISWIFMNEAIQYVEYEEEYGVKQISAYLDSNNYSMDSLRALTYINPGSGVIDKIIPVLEPYSEEILNKYNGTPNAFSILIHLVIIFDKIFSDNKSQARIWEAIDNISYVLDIESLEKNFKDNEYIRHILKRKGIF